jgi:hypothetical protein
MAGLSAFIQRLERMAAADVKSRVMQKVADAAHAECIRGFVEQRDPYGTPWAPRKQGGSWPLLQKTGAGVNSLTARASGERVTMRIRGYFQFHQRGTVRMVARMVFPEPSRGLGTWTQPINDAAVSAVREMASE